MLRTQNLNPGHPRNAQSSCQGGSEGKGWLSHQLWDQDFLHRFMIHMHEEVTVWTDLYGGLEKDDLEGVLPASSNSPAVSKEAT